MIYSISGKAGSGKDMVGQMIKSIKAGESISKYNSDYKIKKFATAANDCYKAITGVDFHSLERVDKELERPDFIKFAQGMKQQFGKNIFVDALMKNYTEDQNWIITDVRFKNELDAIRKYEHLHIHINQFKPGDTVLWNLFYNTELSYGEVVEVKDHTCIVKTKRYINEIDVDELIVIDKDTPYDIFEELNHKTTVFLHNNRTIEDVYNRLIGILK